MFPLKSELWLVMGRGRRLEGVERRENGEVVEESKGGAVEVGSGGAEKAEV